MRKTTVLSLLLVYFFIGCNREPGYLIYPNYKTVYTLFFQTYSVRSLGDISQLQFQKKPDGWHVVIFKQNTVDTVLRDELFWSRKSKTYRILNFNHASSPHENKEHIDRFWRETKTESFNLFPYYNYKGWDWDVIEDYRDRKNLPDSILYALGRSYSYFADNLLNDNSGYSDKRYRFNLKDGPNCLTQEQLEKYNKYHQLSIETYKEVQKLNPKYETMIGDIGTKLADEYMVAYLDMMLYQNQMEANKELQDNIYDYFMVSLAKNYLTSCDSNAILITFGDNDTYPLLYVQARYKFRTDVLIVNSSLLQTSRYIDRMRTPFMNNDPLALSLTPEQYKDGTRDLILFNDTYADHLDGTEHYLDLKDAMDFMLSEDPSKKIDIGSGSEKFNYLPSKKFKFTVNNKNVLASKILSQTEMKNIATEIEWKMQTSYLFKDKLIILNALLTNDWKRPICFCLNGSSTDLCGLDNYLRMQGLVYELVPLNSSKQSFENAAISTPKLYNTFMHKFQWGNMGSGIPLNKGKTYMAENYRTIAYYLAKALIAENKKDSAIKVLDLCTDSIPETTCPYDAEEYGIMDDYYYAGALEKANIISKKLFKVYEDKAIKFSNPNKDDSYRESSFNEAQMTLERLVTIAKEFKQDDLYKDYLNRLRVLKDKGVLLQNQYPDKGLN